MAKDPFSRRSFIKTTTTTTLGVSLAGAALALHQEEPPKPVKVGVIGTGNRGTSLLKNLLAIEGVQTAMYISKEQALVAFREGLGEDAEVLDLLGENDPERLRRLVSQWSDLVAQLVVGNEEPPAIRRRPSIVRSPS